MALRPVRHAEDGDLRSAGGAGRRVIARNGCERPAESRGKPGRGLVGETGFESV